MKSLPFLLKFSYRNLWRAPKRTLIMLLSLSFGAAFIVWDLNFADSGSREIMKEFLGQYAGQYQITQAGYYKKNSKEFDNYKTFTERDVADKSLLKKGTPRVTAPIFVSGQKKTLGVLLTGIDVAKERLFSSLYKSVNVGQFLSPDGDKEIILGKRLAARIEVTIGDEVAVIGQALDGSVANELLKVVGLVDFGGGDLEESIAFTQIHTAQELLAMGGDRFHQIVSFNMESEDLPIVPGLEVVSWRQLIPEISVSIRFIDHFTWIVCMIIVLVISLGLTNSLMITFIEREQEFQSLNILGARSSWVLSSLVIEVFLMGTLSLLIGLMVGHAVTTYFYYFPINIEIFTNGKPIMMGGMVIEPKVRLYPVFRYYWQTSVLIYGFLALTMIYPIVRVIRRSKNAI